MAGGELVQEKITFLFCKGDKHCNHTSNRWALAFALGAKLSPGL